MGLKSIAIIGVGSGGILSICHMLSYLPPGVKVFSIYDPKVPSVGIGESTGPVFWATMELCLGVTFDEILNSGEIDATKKYGTLYKNWREKDFLNPLFGNEEFESLAIHFNTFKIKDYTFNILRKKYQERFGEIQGNVLDIQNKEECVVLNIDGTDHTFDYVIDCRGFTKNFDDYVVLPMPLNHCLVHNIASNEGIDWNYTIHQATENGWMFGVPLTNRLSYGYLFNDTITQSSEAKKDFSKIIGVNIDDMDKTEFKFNSYYIKKVIDNRVMKNGNLAFFLEPMFANSLWMYDYINRLIIDRIKFKVNQDDLNYIFQSKSKQIHDTICYNYQGGSLYNSDFWKHTTNYSKKKVDESLFFLELKEKFKFMKDNNCEVGFNFPFGPKNLKIMDKNFGYNTW